MYITIYIGIPFLRCASLIFHFRRLIVAQVAAERVHVRVFHRPDQTTAELDVFRQRLDAGRLGCRRRSHYRKIRASDPRGLHNRKVRPDDPDLDSKRIQVNFCTVRSTFYNI